MNGWLPVGESLPDDMEFVMIALTDSDYPVWIGYVEDGRWYASNADRLTTVTHWAPLPEGPKR